MVPPAIVHGRAYGNYNLILQHIDSIVPKDGRKNQALTMCHPKGSMNMM
jgi:hypothetical protein